MIPVKQTTFGDGSDGSESGNCMAAAIASVFELPLAEVPNFCQHRDWFQRLCDWLRPRGYAYFESGIAEEMRDPNFDWSSYQVSALGYHLIVGKASRGLLHVIVGFGGKPVHDPHPSDDMLLTHENIGVFVPIDPTVK